MHPSDPVDRGATHDLRAEEMRFGRLSRPGCPGGGDDDDSRGVDQTCLNGREQSKCGRRWVAAGHRYPSGVTQGTPTTGQLGQTVGPGARMLASVETPPLPGIAQPEIGPGIDDQRLRSEQPGDPGARPVRQGQEDDIVAGKILGGSGDYFPVSEGRQVGLVVSQPVAH